MLRMTINDDEIICEAEDEPFYRSTIFSRAHVRHILFLYLQITFSGSRFPWLRQGWQFPYPWLTRCF